MERIRSGNADLDAILDGGFPANAIHVVMGSPGGGKTILAEQLAFENGTSDRPALYLTTFSEPLAKFITFLQEYTFADPARVGTHVIYESIGDALSEHPERLRELVGELLQQYRPSVVVIDSFKAVADLMPSLATWRRQLYELAGLLSAYRTTSFWVGEYSADMGARLPEFAVADGIVELKREQYGARDFRFLRIMKLRGSNFLDGFHALRITKSGLKLFPRLVTPVVSPDYTPIDERVSSGIPGLDAMIATGWLRGTTTLLRGPSGSGKTLMGLQFVLEGVRAGEPALYVTFEENPVQLARVMRRMDWDPTTLIGPARMDVFFTSPVELQIDSIIGELFERVRAHGVRRLVIDGVANLATSADDPLRLRDYLFALAQQLAAKNVTSMLTIQEAGSPASERMMPEVSYLGDNVLLLEMRLGEELARTVRVLKSRGSGHDGRRHPLEIRAGGLMVR